MQLFPSSVSSYKDLQSKSFYFILPSSPLDCDIFLYSANYLNKESAHYQSFALQKPLQEKNLTTHHVSLCFADKSDRCTAYTRIMTTTSNKLHFSWSKLTVTFHMGNRGQIFKSMEIFDSLATKTGWGTVDMSGNNKIKLFHRQQKRFQNLHIYRLVQLLHSKGNNHHIFSNQSVIPIHYLFYSALKRSIAYPRSSGERFLMLCLQNFK